MDSYAGLFDSVEFNAMYSPIVNFNRGGERWALAHGKPMVGNGDVHRLDQLGTTYSLVDAEPTSDAICEAIRIGKVKVQSVPLNLVRAAWIFARLTPAWCHRAPTERTNPLGPTKVAMNKAESTVI